MHVCVRWYVCTCVFVVRVCTVVCVPSRYEPFGMAVLEAWACGKPVVVTHKGGPGEFVHNGQDGIKVWSLLSLSFSLSLSLSLVSVSVTGSGSVPDLSVSMFVRLFVSHTQRHHAHR